MESDGNNKDDKSLSDVTPIPWKKLLSLCIIATAETINYSSIYPYINFMVKDFGVVDDERKLGYWVGLIASSVYMANFLSSYLWGRISDRYGRRPGLLAGLIGGTILSTLLFGFSQSFYWALITRFLSGLLNGNTGIAKTMLGEITDKTNQARAFSLFGLTWSIGGILGPLIGGLLSKPAEQYPSVFGKSSFFKTFPYLLPNLAVVSLGIVGLIVAIFTLPETKKNLLVKGGSERQELLTNESESNSVVLEDLSIENSETSTHSTTSEELIPHHRNTKNPSLLRRTTTCIKTCNLKMIVPEILLDRTVQLTCWIYAILGFLWVIYEEVFPLWSLNSPQSGGLSFTQRDIGLIQAGGGVFTLTFQIFMYPSIAKKLKLVGTFRWGVVIGLPGFILMPEVNRLVTLSRVWVWLCTAFLVILQQASSEMTFVSVIILVSNSSLPETMGTVNGYGQSLVAMLRLFGPFSGSSLLSWSITNGLGFPLDHHFMFYVVSALLLLILGLSFLLPTTINEPKTTNDTNPTS